MSGEPRTTLDVDVSVWVAPEELDDTIDFLCRRFTALRPNPRAFVERYRVLPVSTSNGIRADIVFASIPPEREIIERSRPKKIGDRTVPVASVEDLVFLKLVSTREKDLADARALVRRYRDSLDRAYLLPRLREAAQALDRPDILASFDREL